MQLRKIMKFGGDKLPEDTTLNDPIVCNLATRGLVFLQSTKVTELNYIIAQPICKH
ncbi:MAG: hypothetical protein ABJA70_19925 [Chryseolinea sp.]